MEKFKEGDEVICLPGFSQDSGSMKYGGAGYEEGRIFKIKSIDTDTNVLWPEGGGNGIYGKAVEIYNNQPNYEIY